MSQGKTFSMFRLICLLAIALVSSISNAQTPFPVRTVLSGETISVQKGEYVLTRQVAIRSGGKLILEPGVRIRVQIGLPIQVYGELDIRGTETDPVVVMPDTIGSCGTIAAYPSTGGPRPKLTATYFDLRHSKDSTSLFLSNCDFAISNSKITNQSTATNRICIAVANNSMGTLSNCILDGCNDILTTPVVGINLDSSVESSCDYFGVIFANMLNLVKSSKKYTLGSGSIE